MAVKSISEAAINSQVFPLSEKFELWLQQRLICDYFVNGMQRRGLEISPTRYFNQMKSSVALLN